MRSGLIFTKALTILMAITFLSLVGYSQQNIRRFAAVKSVNVVDRSNAGNNSNDEPGQFGYWLKRQLKKHGIVLVDARNNADAVLSCGNSLIEIVLDDKENVPEKPIYQCDLRSSSGDVLWHRKIKFSTKGKRENDDEYAAERLAGRFFDERSKAQKKYPN
jgi:hypothetical protein